MIRAFVFALTLIFAVGCNSSAVEDILDVIQDPDRKPIDYSKIGVNAFFNDSRFGSISAQASEVRNTLGISFVRVLFAWNDAVQSSPAANPNFSFYDDILAAIPGGVDVLVILTGAPSWIANSSNLVDGNPRTTFVEEWVRAAVSRYGGSGKVIGFEIWNEPNMPTNENSLMGIQDSPSNYVEMLARAHNVIEELAPGKLVVGTATTAINQNFPESLDYNRGMRDAGAENFLDKWNIHYYGKQIENVVQNGGVEGFLDGLSVPVWITESGEQGVNNQLAYGEQMWPFLIDKIPSIERIYIYQFTEATPADVTYGLRNLSSDFPVSDLYIALRDR